MSAYENVVAGKLRLKGKALDVRDGGTKKKKKQKERYVSSSRAVGHDLLTDENNVLVTDTTNLDVNGTNIHNGGGYDRDERLTPAERRYLDRWQKIELQRLAKTAKKSHRDSIQEFNQYLTDLSDRVSTMTSPKWGLADHFTCVTLFLLFFLHPLLLVDA